MGRAWEARRGGDVNPANQLVDFGPASRAKAALSSAWYAAAVRGDSATADRLLRDAGIATHGKTSKVGVSPDSVPPDGGGSFPASRVLSITHASQNTGYFCGPATGYMIIRYLHGTGFTSRYDGSQPGQAGLANANHMRTDINKSTEWATGYFVRGANRWNGDSYYVQVPKPSSLASVITYSVGAAGKPMAADTVEFAGGVHYNNHPTSKTIGHWIMGYGYASSGSTSYFADPVGGSSAVPWSGPVAKAFSYSSSSFTSRFLQSNGVAY